MDRKQFFDPVRDGIIQSENVTGKWVETSYRFSYFVLSSGTNAKTPIKATEPCRYL